MNSIAIEIRVGPEDFKLQAEYDALCSQNTLDGAIVFFVGRVRDFNEGETVIQLHLEHYPGMTEKVLSGLAEQATERWPLNRIRIVHRIGDLGPAEQIVFVGVSSPHREDAFRGASFLMDSLKTTAPFWKKETSLDGTSSWLDSREIDRLLANRWD
jgi:molybdopterin synthase catalytic subunit